MEKEKTSNNPEVEEQIQEDQVLDDVCCQNDEKTTEMQLRIEDLTTQLTRLQADFKNYKNRAEKERKDYISYGIRELAMNLLPVLDNLERALNEGPKGGDDPFYDGVKLIYEQWIGVLKNHKIEAMEADGTLFDPEFHHAVLMEESDGVESGHITAVLQKGYLFGEEVLRPAMVKVAQ